MAEDSMTDLTTLTVQLLSAYVSRNTVSSDSLADLIKTTREALGEKPTVGADEPATETYKPAVSVRKSIASPDHIISLIDGKPYKTLKRHLATHGLTPDQYRERYNLPASYPLVAQTYSEARRAVAQKLGLGKKPAAPAPAPQAESARKETKKATKKPSTSNTAAGETDKPTPAATKSSVKAKGEARKRLSIALPTESKSNGNAQSVPPAADTVGVKVRTKKAAPAAKPKSLKTALQDANSHLGADKAP